MTRATMARATTTRHARLSSRATAAILLAVASAFAAPSALAAQAAHSVRAAHPAQTDGAPFCEPGQEPAFSFGFAELKALLGDRMGEPIECEHVDPAAGDIHQATTTGLAYYRRATNTPTFTDGWRRWALTPRGLQTWIGTAVDAPATSASDPPGPPPEPRPGRLLVADDFDDPARRVLSTADVDPRVSFAYEDGEYVIRKLDASAGLPYTALGGGFSDSALAIDVRLVGETAERLVVLGCRRQDAPRASEYRFVVEPAAGRAALARVDDGEIRVLVPLRPSPVIQRGTATNRVELSCSGTTIAGSVNGVEVASAQDARYREGQWTIGASTFEEGAGPAEARFDNLVLTER